MLGQCGDKLHQLPAPASDGKWELGYGCHPVPAFWTTKGNQLRSRKAADRHPRRIRSRPSAGHTTPCSCRWTTARWWRVTVYCPSRARRAVVLDKDAKRASTRSGEGRRRGVHGDLRHRIRHGPASLPDRGGRGRRGRSPSGSLRERNEPPAAIGSSRPMLSACLPSLLGADAPVSRARGPRRLPDGGSNGSSGGVTGSVVTGEAGA